MTVMWHLLLLSAVAGPEPTLTVMVESGDPPRLLEAFSADTAPTPPGALEGPRVDILDAEGSHLRSVAMPLPPQRSIIHPQEAHGDVGTTPGLVSWTIPWPADAASLRLGDQTLTPTERHHGDTVLRSLQESGPTDARLDLVVFSEGFTTAELASFEAETERVLAHLRTIAPWTAYYPALNVWQVSLSSDESGIGDDLTGEVKNTAFSCAYGCDGLDRLICCDEARVANAIATHAPFADASLLLVNERTEYGGSGGPVYATSYIGEDGPQVVAHELAHSLIGLWDEYTYGTDGDATGAPNCAPDDQEVPWAEWLDAPLVDAYTPCTWNNAVRPTASSCMMLQLQDQYCPICREQTIRRVHSAWPPDREFEATPEVGSTLQLQGPDDSVAFDIATVFPIEHTTWRWRLNGAVLEDNAPDFRLEGCATDDGLLELELVPDGDADWLSPTVEESLTLTLRWQVEHTQCRGCRGCSGPGSPGWWLLIPAIGLFRRRS